MARGGVLISSQNGLMSVPIPKVSQIATTHSRITKEAQLSIEFYVARAI